MKIRIELDESLQEEELVIRCRQVDARTRRLEAFARETFAPVASLTFCKGDEEYYFPLDEVLFFETDGDKVFAHTAKDIFLVRYRLYELEQCLPRQFIRAAKGAILNVRHVYSIRRDLTSSSLVQFAGSHKELFISRLYYKEVKQRLDDERSKL